MLQISERPDYYSPYPTLTTMRGQAGLGQLPGLPPDATSQKLEVYYRKLAKQLGVTLPPRPAGATLGQSQVLDTLEAIDLSAAILGRIGDILFRQMVSGGAHCDDISRYNRLAIETYETQRDTLRTLRDGGIKSVPLAPPWPPLFVGVGEYAAAPGQSFWELDCKTDIVQLATKGREDGIRIMMRVPCQTGSLGAFEPTTGTIIVVVTGAVLIAGMVDSWFESSANTERTREESRRVLENLRMLLTREEIIDRRKDECRAAGKDYFDCLEAARDSTWAMSDQEAANEAARIRGRGKGRSWLWWVGLVAVVVGGVVVYKAVKRRKRGGGRRGTEIIDVS